jgi:hypothetical protein
MSDSVRCAFCNQPATLHPAEDANGHEWRCARCGKYVLDGPTESDFRDKAVKSPGAISGWVRRQNVVGVVPRIDGKLAAAVRALKKPPFKVRAERYLVTAAGKCSKLTDEFLPNSSDLIGASYSDDDAEVTIVRKYLEEEQFIFFMEAGGPYRITARGYIACDELAAKRAASTQGFVAMWFAAKMDGVYESGLKVGIENAGYAPMIIRNKEHTNKIDDEIVAEIRRSAFLVADFTGHRGGVYFEAGFALGLGRPVIWTCNFNEISKLHFDIRQYNCIDWSEPADLAARLQKRIEALLGRGPHTCT